MTQFGSNTPQLYLDVDRTKVRSMGITIAEVNSALQIFLGSLYTNSFNAFGRFWQVNVMAEGRFRNSVNDIKLMKVRNSVGEMVPLSLIASLRDFSGPVMVTRYNLYPASPVNGAILPFMSTGEAIQNSEQLASTLLPRSMATEWTELAFLQVRAGNTAMYVFALSVVFVFLALAALYESWSLPLAVILVVPLCILCSVAGVALHADVDQHIRANRPSRSGGVGLQECDPDCRICQATAQCRSADRPGNPGGQPAAAATDHDDLAGVYFGSRAVGRRRGGGAEMRRSLGTAVFSGMLGVTLFGIFLTPVFFKVIEGWSEMSLFANPRLQWVGSVLIGVTMGTLLGFLMWKIGFPSLRWAIAIGCGLGILVASLIRHVFDWNVLKSKKGK